MQASGFKVRGYVINHMHMHKVCCVGKSCTKALLLNPATEPNPEPPANLPQVGT